MPTFIDESGDTSHHPDAQSYYRLAAAWIPTARTDALRVALAQVRVEFDLPAEYEFKYHKTHYHPNRRRAFFGATLAHGLRFVVASIDKRRKPWPAAPRDEFFHTTAMYLAATLRPIYHAQETVTGKLLREPIVVDDNDDGVFLDCVRYAFRGIHSRAQPGIPLAQKPKFAASHVAELLQVADMVCGAVGEMLDGDGTWYDQIASAGIGPEREWQPSCDWLRGVGCWR